jgi:hypothetical protein
MLCFFVRVFVRVILESHFAIGLLDFGRLGLSVYL